MSHDTLSPPTRKWLEQGRLVEVLGRQLFVVEAGQGPTLLFLHGFPTSCFDWRELIGLLSSKFRCVAFDFPGFGLSDKPDDYSYSLFQQADHVEALANELRITEAHVVSHDMGTSVHCELLARQKQKRLGFEICASTFTNGSMMQWLAKITPFQQMLASNELLPKAMEVCAAGMGNHVAALKALMRRPEAWSKVDETIIHELMMYQNGPLRIPALGGYMRERYVHRERWMGGIESGGGDVQFVWSQNDPIAVIEMGRAMHERFPAAAYSEIPEAGHFLVVERPGPIAEQLEAFDEKRRKAKS